ncbi:MULTISPECIES: hypothetical protein [unclassified Pseudoalteromonas]|uniref:hypothetical protein n=1 Tax=unclassified Pseudoalteromonas TaxID=194690 RepID=UPI0009789A41|nr:MULTISPECIES: hypothetical protein [unclassified Pseudoalteromonas]
MEGYLQTGVGILVSLILFVIGYRQTIGAKKERSKNANISIIRTIMRRMVLEDSNFAFRLYLFWRFLVSVLRCRKANGITF